MRASDATATEPALERKFVVLLVLVVAVARVLAIRSFPIYDDAFITWRYAQNLAAGEGLVFNPGAPWEPILGTTTPGYAVLLAFFARIGAQIDTASLALNITCDAASVWLLCELLDRRAFASCVAVAAFAGMPEIARVSVGGMEAPLFLLLALSATCAMRASWFVLAGVLSALACTVRPEGVLLIAALALVHVRAWRQAVQFGLPVVLLGALYAGALSTYFGDPIPQSIKAKAVFYGLGPRLARAGSVLLQAFGPSTPARLLAPLSLLGFVLVFTRRNGARALVVFALAMVGAYAASGTKTWGWYFYVPLLGWCIALGLGVEALYDFIARARPALARWRKGASVTVALAALAVAFAWSSAVTDRVTPLVYERMRERVRGAHDRDVTICASDIGAIGWFSGARILDSEGLVWPEGRRFERQVDVVREHLPDYVLLVANQARTPPFFEDPIAASYEPIARFNATGADELRPTRDQLPDGWAQDYILLRRRSPALGY